ncbi:MULTISPECIES: 5-oxoprolinase subunit PxpB [unclassified Pseudoalteromonas]|uniref:5-oxoprolinase subunit PxpB n=1 Tax=unclassified Pseudoalteromonas TaxID=194690 RepID=UPI000B3CB7E4|nr:MULTISPECIES: 5-oxoprolinase subunit PxpB [unclassified Pseudoalteromonas]MDN3377908.1 5-oxoprolinase subunit PxpB [Pseudoalteromonas sp. APC 3893]MDN3386103.1 5-oxoprolinase subunit PxpB [Pseudoalteromonas sp. APC 4017]OUS68991.1 allophanate hydrolase [Pseudoalteromonas sp. A601]
MDLKTTTSVVTLSSNSLFLDATHLSEDTLKIQKKIWALAAKCKASNAFIDVVPAMNSLCVYLHNSDELVRWQNELTNWWQDIDTMQHQGTHHKVITHYGGEHGPDLDFVAKAHNLTTHDVIQLHSNARYQVLFLGFQPGFVYLHGLTEQLHTPRRDNPRTKVPKGSVAIGANQTGIYPADSPGGWHIIGHTDFNLFDYLNNPPSVIQPGDTLSFVSVES